jgi:hypothetical protein
MTLPDRFRQGVDLDAQHAILLVDHEAGNGECLRSITSSAEAASPSFANITLPPSRNPGATVRWPRGAGVALAL